MIITKEEYEKLTKKQKKDIKYSNPCITNNPNELRVGEVFDDWLGYWKPASLNDF